MITPDHVRLRGLATVVGWGGGGLQLIDKMNIITFSDKDMFLFYVPRRQKVELLTRRNISIVQIVMKDSFKTYEGYSNFVAFVSYPSFTTGRTLLR